MTTVLISDKLSDAAIKIFRDNAVEVDFQPELGKDPEGLAAVIGGYDGLAIRSATKVTADLISRAENLKVIARNGVGYDKVDLDYCTERGIVVTYTPGAMVDVGSHLLHLDCRGEGLPTVLLEAGQDVRGSLSWTPIRDSLTDFTRVCAYDRAGILWSEMGPQPRLSPTIAAELSRGLEAAGMQPLDRRPRTGIERRARLGPAFGP